MGGVLCRRGVVGVERTVVRRPRRRAVTIDLEQIRRDVGAIGGLWLTDTPRTHAQVLALHCITLIGEVEKLKNHCEWLLSELESTRARGAANSHSRSDA